jgi:hypothetical protein
LRYHTKKYLYGVLYFAKSPTVTRFRFSREKPTNDSSRFGLNETAKTLEAFGKRARKKP